MYAVITENDESQWSDETGCLYHFPKRYSNILTPGTKVIYYKGSIKDKSYSLKRLSDSPHYFGVAEIGKIYLDKRSTKGDLFAIIEKYRNFSLPVPAKIGHNYLEKIPENRVANFWRDGVRVTDKSVYDEILSLASIGNISEPPINYLADDSNDVEVKFESGMEGEQKMKYVTFYERDPKLRKQAIAIHGTTCAVCGFNFGFFYGSYGEGFIHIHHINPVSELGAPTLIDPETDLAPLCANCHSIIHRKKENTLSLQILREMIASKKNR